jgi:hypothetical protein
VGIVLASHIEVMSKETGIISHPLSRVTKEQESSEYI